MSSRHMEKSDSSYVVQVDPIAHPLCAQFSSYRHKADIVPIGSSSLLIDVDRTEGMLVPEVRDAILGDAVGTIGIIVGAPTPCAGKVDKISNEHPRWHSLSTPQTASLLQHGNPLGDPLGDTLGVSPSVRNLLAPSGEEVAGIWWYMVVYGGI